MGKRRQDAPAAQEHAVGERAVGAHAIGGRAVRGCAVGACACGGVQIEIDLPAFWAWHDHSAASRVAQGCAYATYVGCWRSRVRVVSGDEQIARYRDEGARSTRSFCATCGSPLFYERARAPKMVNIPRALFAARTGREPRYHLALEEAPDWSYQGAPLAPLKNYPGVLVERRRRKSAAPKS